VSDRRRARLTHLAKTQGDVVDRVFLRYAIERLLYRLAQCGYRDHFVLKGSMPFHLGADEQIASAIS
jgi:hypothetical protein